MRILLDLSLLAISVRSFSALVTLLFKNALSCRARRRRVCLTCFWVGFLRSLRFMASSFRSMMGTSGGLGVTSVKVANAEK